MTVNVVSQERKNDSIAMLFFLSLLNQQPRYRSHETGQRMTRFDVTEYSNRSGLSENGLV
jgi:hypothetical protein